jgi:hypothetical protein
MESQLSGTLSISIDIFLNKIHSEVHTPHNYYSHHESEIHDAYVHFWQGKFSVQEYHGLC